MAFKADFVWGAAASSYQIEGAWNEDGKGVSVWDVFSSQEGNVWRSQDGNKACNHYHHYKSDVDLMGKIGIKAYRLSLSWPRILPEGTGKVNPKGIDFYDRLIDQLLEKNIVPWVTLFHWDYPYALYRRGGWLNPDSPDWFADYAADVVRRFSDRVQNWMTLNEPQAYIGLGHQDGRHAPGLKLPLKEVLQAGHNTLLAHGKAVRAIREHAIQTPRIGAAQANFIWVPTEATEINVNIARKMNFSVHEKHMWNNTWFSDPMVLGRYPEDGLNLFESHLPDIHPDDMKIISEKMDYFAVNIYFGHYVNQKGKIVQPVGGPLTTMEWDIIPSTLYWGPRFLHERYELPIVVTENGMANCDWIHDDGKVHDPQRIDYLHTHLGELRRAARDGVPIDGYFQWSIMDNFEWVQGYKQRFGLIFVDYDTQKRILKDSAYWYKKVIETNGDEL